MNTAVDGAGRIDDRVRDGDIDTFRIRDLSANDAGHHLYDNTVGLIHQILLPDA